MSKKQTAWIGKEVLGNSEYSHGHIYYTQTSGRVNGHRYRRPTRDATYVEGEVSLYRNDGTSTLIRFRKTLRRKDTVEKWIVKMIQRRLDAGMIEQGL